MRARWVTAVVAGGWAMGAGMPTSASRPANRPRPTVDANATALDAASSSPKPLRGGTRGEPVTRCCPATLS